MSDRDLGGNGGDADQSPNILVGPTLALSMWNPFLSGALRANAQAHEGFGTLGSEWQDFTGRQFKEGLALMQRLSHSRTPDQALAAYSEFWQKAAEDYGKEIATMSKLMSGVTAKIVVAAQSAAHEERRR